MSKSINFFLTEFQNQIRTYMTYGAADVSTAIRWILDANDWDSALYTTRQIKAAKKATWDLNKWPSLKNLDAFMRALGLYNDCLPDVHLLNHHNDALFNISLQIAEAASLSHSDIIVIAGKYPSLANRWVRTARSI